MNNRKTPTLYILILIAWFILLLIATPALFEGILVANITSWPAGILVTLSTLFIAYFWLNGTKDVVYTMVYHLKKKRLVLPSKYLWAKTKGVTNRPHVVMVYCTYNDFNEHSLLESMKQDYRNNEVVILDDSTKREFIEEINLFAMKYNLKVVRRKDHVGFKAGNLNNYLQTAEFDYFVILDSDEIVPTNFITRSLDYFAADPTTGVVQANHIATRNRNKFMKLFAIGVDSHWPAYQTLKNDHGFLSLLGHGAMVSKECYQTVGGFPHVVAEDLCFSIAAREKGYFVTFAPDILCEEEYPIDYLAFKKRHSKWTQGNMEFIKKFTGTIVNSPMRWFEKLDIVLFTYNLPLTAFFALYVVINVILLPLIGYNVNYPAWMLVPTIAFLFAPMLNDIITYRKTLKPWTMAWYLLHTVLLYGSMLYISLVASTKSLFGKSVFVVTPKEASNVSFLDAVKGNKGELMFAAGLISVTWILNDSILPVLLIVVPSILSVYMAMVANKKQKKLKLVKEIA